MSFNANFLALHIHKEIPRPYTAFILNEGQGRSSFCTLVTLPTKLLPAVDEGVLWSPKDSLQGQRPRSQTLSPNIWVCLHQKKCCKHLSSMTMSSCNLLAQCCLHFTVLFLKIFLVSLSPFSFVSGAGMTCWRQWQPSLLTPLLEMLLSETKRMSTKETVENLVLTCSQTTDSLFVPPLYHHLRNRPFCAFSRSMKELFN